jgi:hypothetical protein
MRNDAAFGWPRVLGILHGYQGNPSLNRSWQGPTPRLEWLDAAGR